MKNYILALFCLFGLSAFGQLPTLSPKAEVSVITLGPDQDELVQAFGHSAFHIIDPANDFDFAFNYGVFSFNQPNFYLNFARGHNLYLLGVSSYTEFIQPYIQYNRSIHEQVLDLTQEQKQKVFEYLYWNAKPENRSYLYDYFFNNCATKIRDVLKESVGTEIRFDSTFIKTHYTIRGLTDSYLVPLPWGDLGLDIGLGSPIDRKATAQEHMFLPDYIESSFDHASILTLGNYIPLVKTKKVIFAGQPVPPQKSLIHPWTAFGGLLIVVIAITVLDWRRKKISFWLDGILFFSIGLVGLVLLLLWTATDHHACARNYNLLWALPTHLLVLIFLLKKNKPSWLKYYFLATAALSMILLITWPILYQPLNVFLIPVVASVLVRSMALHQLLPGILARKA
jgi:hypothetical protein